MNFTSQYTQGRLYGIWGKDGVDIHQNTDRDVSVEEYEVFHELQEEMEEADVEFLESKLAPERSCTSLNLYTPEINSITLLPP